MNVLVSTILVCLIFVVTLAPRRMALLGMMAGILYLTQGQSIDIMGINLYPMRLLELSGFIRVIIRKELSRQNINKIDRAFIIFYSYVTIIRLIRASEPATVPIGAMVDATLSYITFRALINNIFEFRLFCKDFVIILLPYVGLVLIDYFTGVNYLTLVGGLSEYHFRSGRPRYTGSFQVAITFGTLGASFLSPYIAMVFGKNDRARAFTGIALCLIIVFLSNSGGPLNSTIIVLSGWLLWFVRSNMIFVRNGIIAFLFLLAIFMKAPIWYLPAKVSNFSGGGGWHRSYLIEQAIKHLSEWWIVGIPKIATADWLPYTLHSGSADITNQFIAFGLSSGIVAIFLFIFLLRVSLLALSRALKALRSYYQNQKTTEEELMLWGFGVMFYMHIVNWFGVCYFDQIKTVWFMQLAAMASISNSDLIPLGELQEKDNE